MDIAVANVVIKNIKSEKIFMDLIQKDLLQEHYFMQKVREAMKSIELHKMNDSVQVDKITIGGKKRRETAQVTTDEWKGYKPIKDFHITQIPQYLTKQAPQ